MIFTNQFFMNIALKEAKRAADENEIPVGAIIVQNNKIIAKAHNQTEKLNDATAHAEIIALTQAFNAIGDRRLNDCTMFVTLEPCAMCCGAIVLARLGCLVFAARDWQLGAALSNFNILQFEKNLHKVDIIEGVLEDEAKSLLNNFFSQMRRK